MNCVPESAWPFARRAVPRQSSLLRATAHETRPPCIGVGCSTPAGAESTAASCRCSTKSLEHRPHVSLHLSSFHSHFVFVAHFAHFEAVQAPSPCHLSTHGGGAAGGLGSCGGAGGNGGGEGGGQMHMPHVNRHLLRFLCFFLMIHPAHLLCEQVFHTSTHGGGGEGGGGGEEGGAGTAGGEGGESARNMVDRVWMVALSKLAALGTTVGSCVGSTSNHSARGLHKPSHGVVGIMRPPAGEGEWWCGRVWAMHSRRAARSESQAGAYGRR